jgi:hypothetical protein
MNRIDIDAFNMAVFMITQYDIIHSAGQYENTQQDPDIIYYGFFRSRDRGYCDTGAGCFGMRAYNLLSMRTPPMLGRIVSGA